MTSPYDLHALNVPCELDTPPEALELLEERALEYLRAGGVVDWSLWQALSQDARSAFARAGDRLRRIRIREVAEELAEDLAAAGEQAGRPRERAALKRALEGVLR